MALTDVREGLLMLEDGSVFRGRCSAPGTAFGEVVFNTSMTGYQEILTDPSYRRQIVVMTQPHIGNYGTQDEVAESHRPWAEGFIARRFTPRPSNHGNEKDLVEYLRDRGVPALSGIDTFEPDEGFAPGDIVAYRCRDCLDRWDVELNADDIHVERPS